MIITFCGHADYIEKPDDEKNMLHLFHSLIGQSKVCFYLGGYGNFDKFVLKCANKYKSSNKQAKIIFVTPYIDVNYKKLRNEKSLYDEIIYPNIENSPKRFAIVRRNEWMVNHSNYLISYVCHNFGGAYKTLQYAKKNSIFIIDFNNFAMTNNSLK